MVNVPTGLNNLKTKDPIDLKKLSDIVSKEVIKSTKFNKLNTKVNNLENKIPDASTLIQTNQYNTDKQSLGKKYDMLIKIHDVSDLVSTTVLNTKIGLS